MTWSEAAERCVKVARARSLKPPTPSAQLSSDDVFVEEQTTGTHLSIGALTSVAAKAIVMQVQKRPTIPIIIHLLPSIRDKARDLDLDLQYDLVACFQSCEMPVVTVCEADVLVERDQCLLVLLADIVIMSASASISISGIEEKLLKPGWEARAGPAFRHTLAQVQLTK